MCSEIGKVRLERELKIADESGVPVKGALWAHAFFFTKEKNEAEKGEGRVYNGCVG